MFDISLDNYPTIMLTYLILLKEDIMLKRARLTTKQKVDIINAYSEQLTPMMQLAKQYGVTRQAIYKIIRKAGVSTLKEPIYISCTSCTQSIKRNKARIRKQLNHFCSRKCYNDFLTAGNGNPYIQSRSGQIIARSIVSQYFSLQENHIVHHENRNCLDNCIKNLRVFATQGDHLRHHRGFDVIPLWDGRHP